MIGDPFTHFTRADSGDGWELRDYFISHAATYKYTTGSANSVLSTRSSQPPWPGSSVPLSFTPAPRLRADSQRSPNCPATLAPAVSASATAGGTSGIAQRRKKKPKIRDAPSDAAAPSQDLPGLTMGASLWRPTARPT